MLVEDLKAKLSIKNIPNIIGEPTNKAINEMSEAMYANADTIPETLGGGAQFPCWVDYGRISVCKPFRYGIHKTDGASPVYKTRGRKHRSGASRHKRDTQGGAEGLQSL